MPLPGKVLHNGSYSNKPLKATKAGLNRLRGITLE